jgi:hypothetical protein
VDGGLGGSGGVEARDLLAAQLLRTEGSCLATSPLSLQGLGHAFQGSIDSGLLHLGPLVGTLGAVLTLQLGRPVALAIQGCLQREAEWFAPVNLGILRQHRRQLVGDISVRAIVERTGLMMPSFFGYALRATLILGPALILHWWLLIR